MAKIRSNTLRRTAKTQAKRAIADGTIRVWEDDPGSGVLVERPAPSPSKRPLAYSFPGAST
jgi:hypothetical protein